MGSCLGCWSVMVESMKSSVEEREDAVEATSEELSRGQVEVVESS